MQKKKEKIVWYCLPNHYHLPREKQSRTKRTTVVIKQLQQRSYLLFHNKQSIKMKGKKA
jgi:hypothetical protein